MIEYRNIWPLSLLLLLALFLAWCLAAWPISSLVRRKTAKSFRVVFYLSFPFLLIILGITLWQTAELVQILVTKPWVMLPLNFLASFVFLWIPAALLFYWSFPTLWRAARNANVDSLSDPLMRARFVTPRISVPVQMGVSGSFLALFIVFFAPSLFVETLSLVVWLGYSRWRWSRQAKLTDNIIENGIDVIPRFWSRWVRRAVIVFSYVASVVLFILVIRSSSLLPGSFSMGMDMPMPAGTAMIDMTQLTGPRDAVPDRRFTLTAQKANIKFDNGQTLELLTYDGQIPGPEIRVRQGELIEVTLRNKDIEKGVTIHWHGVNVPNAEDGVAGVTQDAVMPGESYVYRFRAVDAGTYWYHSHQLSFEQINKGLYGAFIVEPQASDAANTMDMTVLAHAWQDPMGTFTFSTFGASHQDRKRVPPNTNVRLRLINTFPVTSTFGMTGTTFKVAAIDGVDLNQPGDLEHERMWVSAGGRYDLQFTMPDHPVSLSTFIDGNPILDTSVLLSPDGTGEFNPEKRTGDFNPINYGKSRDDSPLPAHFDQEHVFEIDSGSGFTNGTFGLVWLVNGRKAMNIPHMVVREGQWIKMKFINRSFDDHPMHTHGHRMRVLSRNGQPSTGSPWWSDTLNVAPGETMEVAFKADNPGVWMDHCHNLFHAVEGFVMHLSYENVMTPFKVGTQTRNTPE